VVVLSARDTVRNDANAGLGRDVVARAVRLRRTPRSLMEKAGGVGAAQVHPRALVGATARGRHDADCGSYAAHNLPHRAFDRVGVATDRLEGPMVGPEPVEDGLCGCVRLGLVDVVSDRDRDDAAVRHGLGDVHQQVLRDVSGRACADKQGRRRDLGQVLPPPHRRVVDLLDDGGHDVPVERELTCRAQARVAHEGTAAVRPP
jgi:hypothetical protein